MAIELNEARWWSKWARLRWQGDAFLLTSEAFRESFFNRAGSLTCEGVARAASWAERDLLRRGVNATMLVFDSCKASSEKLLEEGYARVDTMSVLTSRAPIEWDATPGLTVKVATSTHGWTDGYLRAFYGNEDLTPCVSPIVARLLKAKGVTLLESRITGATVGVLAIFRTHGLGGVYCVGTVPEYRRLGVAAVMLAEAKRMIEGEGRRLVLQALTSEGAVDYYLRRGFEILYSKQVLERKFK